MATISYSVAADNTNASTFYNWAHRISAAFATFGWVQTADTGQVVWPISIVNISSVSFSSPNTTYTYTLLQGVALRTGGVIIITGCASAGNNGTFTIASQGTGTFTVANASGVTEAEVANHAYGGINPQVLITSATGNGSTNTYTYTALDGTIRAGETIVVTGCTTVGFNGTFIIASVGTAGSPASLVFTTTTGISQAQETENNPQGSPALQPTGLVTSNSCATTTGTATTTATSLPPVGSNTLSEFWGMGDALQATAPVIVQYIFGMNGNGIAGALYFTMGTQTNGAGVFIGSNVTGSLQLLVSGNSTASTTPSQSWLSGDTNRILGAMWPGTAGSGERGGYFSIERSHNNAGVDTSDYVSILTTGGTNTQSLQNVAQVSLNQRQITTLESRWQVICTHSVITAGFGSSCLLSPVFPIVGAVGLPMINTLIGKKVDWTDQIQFTWSLYGTMHTYQVSNTSLSNGLGGLLTYDGTPTVAIIFRYE
jgi:hypothetical protein